MTSLLRIPFMFTAALAVKVAGTPPNPPPDESEKLRPTGSERLFSKTIPWTPVIAQIFYWTWTVLEAAVIVASAFPASRISSDILSNLVAADRPIIAASRMRVTPTFLLGWFFAVSGGLIRLSCYRALGKLFTFELGILKDHKLVTTGPYAYVRHPSYTGLITGVLGFSLCHLAEGSWLRECSGLSLDDRLGQSLMSVWALGGVFVISVMIARTEKEDNMLRKEFSEWDEWAKKVPYKLIPYVL